MCSGPMIALPFGLGVWFLGWAFSFRCLFVALLWFVHFDGHGVPSLPRACPCADCFHWGVRSVVWLAWLRCNALRCKCVAVSRSFDGLSGLLCGLRVCVASLGLALAL